MIYSPTNPFPASHPYHAVHFKGGMPSLPPPPDPPVTERRTEVVTAERMTRMDALKRKGQLATLFAGKFGSSTNDGDQYKRKTLLGG
jgi:hypothetical protein